MTWDEAEEKAKARLVEAVKERDRRVAEAQEFLRTEVEAYNEALRKRPRD